MPSRLEARWTEVVLDPGGDRLPVQKITISPFRPIPERHAHKASRKHLPWLASGRCLSDIRMPSHNRQDSADCERNPGYFGIAQCQANSRPSVALIPCSQLYDDR